MDINAFKDRLAAGRLSRRELNRVLASVGLATVTVPLGSRVARADEQASYFTWSGYDIPELFPEYIEKHGTAPDTPLFADIAEAFTKLRGGYQVDVAHPCSSDVARWRDAGIIQAIDTSRLSNWPDVFPSLQSIKNTVFDGQHWFAPFDWGQTAITYRTDLVEVEEDSWSLLWDERYAGRLSVIDAAEDAWWCAAIYAGVDVENLTDADIAKVRDLLAQQRPLMRFYNSNMSEVEQALASGELVAAMTWNSSPLELTKEGVPVRFMIPKEGALTWVCGMVLTSNATHYDKAHDVIDALIGQQSGVFLIKEYGYGHGNMKAFEAVAEEDLVARGLSKDPQAVLDSGVFVTSVGPELAAKIENDWDEIQTGM